MRALVIGGTGPTGHFIVNGLLERGYDVAILHTGNHEVAEIPESVVHIHTNPFDEQALRSALGDSHFDITLAMYGRLRRVAEIMVGRTERFISVGGGPAYRGFMNADMVHPPGLPVPTGEDAVKTTSEAEDGKGYRVYRSEEVVFTHHPNATHFRYPQIYGAYQVVPREWSIVRRILDRRPFIVLPDDGLSLNHSGAAANAAHALLLAVDQPEVAAGQVYNCGDDHVLTLKQVVQLCAEALGHEWEMISMPYDLAVSARPLISQPWTTHRMFDLTKIKSELGYRDIVSPVEGIKQAAVWLRDHPLAYGGREEVMLQDPFDYAAEDRLVAAWKRAIQSMPKDLFQQEPGYTASYSGPGGSRRKGSW